MYVTIYGRFCPDEGIVAVFRVDRKNNIKTAICASLSRWLPYHNIFIIYKLRQYPHGRS